jgi:hypothetical protein
MAHAPLTGHGPRVQAWIDWLHGSREPDGLSAQLSPEVVFWSPVVHSPIEGPLKTFMYLSAAGVVFDMEKFHYTRIFDCGDRAVLEFVTEIDGLHVNGVDILEWDADGKITEFKVMVRPLRAIHAVHAKMKAMLERGPAG